MILASEIPSIVARLRLPKLSKVQDIELDIRMKKRVLSFWQTKVNHATYYLKQNQQKIKDLEKKLKKAKILEDLE